MDNKKSKKGFTIIELLAAIVIVGILASVAAITVNRYILQGHDTVNDQLSKQLILSAKSYYSDNENSFKNVGSDGVVIWYTTLKANDYITNDLVDSDGNSCGNSYVVYNAKEDDYTSCIICDNDGYNNTNDTNDTNKVCTNSLSNNISCYWYDGDTLLNDNSEIKMGIKKDNKKEFTLKCKGRGIKFYDKKNNSFTTSVTSDMFGSTESNSSIEVNTNIDSKSTSSGLITSFDAKVTFTATVNGDSAIHFYDGSVYACKDDSKCSPSDATIPSNKGVEFKGIKIDGTGPSCTLSGPYKDSTLKTQVKSVKGGSTVYYGLTCYDASGIGNVTSDDIKGGFNTSSAISNLNVYDFSNNGKEVKAGISVTVNNPNINATKKVFDFSLVLNKDVVKDNYDNGNEEVTSQIDGKASVLSIDDQGPTCAFNGPAYNAEFTTKKSRMDVTQSNEYAYYELRCTDENGIDPSTFKFSDIKSYEFGSIQQSGDMLAIKNNDNEVIGYRYLIIANKKNVTTLSTQVEAYLTYDASNVKDTVGNSGSNTYKSSTVKMVDGTKIPTCNLSVSYSNGYAILSGSISSTNELTGYAWSTDYGDPSSYISISGTSKSVSTSVYDDGVYYLHMKDSNGLTGYCRSDSYVYIPTPDEPLLIASDGKSSGSWHNSNFTLTASGSGSGVTYYYGTSPSSLYYTSSRSVSSETTGDTYYAKACWSSNPNICSSTVQYLAMLDKTAPTCNITMTKYKGTSSSPTWTANYSNGYWTQYNVKVVIENNCSDSGGSGLDGDPYMTKDGSGKYVKYAVINSDQTDGLHTLEIYAYDKAGNSYTATKKVYRDTVAPTLKLSPAPTSSGKKLKTGDKVTVTCSDSTSGIRSDGMVAEESSVKNISTDIDLTDAPGGSGSSSITKTVTFNTTGNRFLRVGCVDGALNGTWGGDVYGSDAYYVVSKRTYTKKVSTLEYYWSTSSNGSGSCSSGINCCTSSSGRVCSPDTHGTSTNKYFTSCSAETEKKTTYSYDWEYSKSGGSSSKQSGTAATWCKNNGYSATYTSCSRDCTSSLVGDTCRTASGGSGSKVTCKIYKCTKSSSTTTVKTGNYNYSNSYTCLKNTSPTVKTYTGETSCTKGTTTKSNGKNGTYVITTTCTEED